MHYGPHDSARILQGSKAVLADVYVRPHCRCTGLKQDLLGAVLDHAAGRVDAVRLGVSADNPAAFRLYQRHGSREYGREAGALRATAQDWNKILMERRLGE